MLNCKEVTRLVSESFDRQLTLRERFGLRLHTMMCGTCRLFRQLQNRIQNAIKICSRPTMGSMSEDIPSLSDTSKTRMQLRVLAENEGRTAD